MTSFETTRLGLYAFKCDHGNFCNFLTGCPECAREQVKELRARIDVLESERGKVEVVGYQINGAGTGWKICTEDAYQRLRNARGFEGRVLVAMPAAPSPVKD